MLYSLFSIAVWWFAGLLDDLLTLPLRPLMLVHHVLPTSLLNAVFQHQTIITHFIAMIATLLVLVSFYALVHPKSNGWPHLIAVIYSADSLLQLRSAICLMAGLEDTWKYPLTNTLLPPVVIQVPFIIGWWFPDFVRALRHMFLDWRFPLFCISFCSRFLAATVPSHLPTWLPYGLTLVSYIAFAFLITPMFVWDLIGDGLEKTWKFVYPILLAISTAVYTFITYIWPRLMQLLIRILTSPPLILFHRWVLEPVWHFIAPFILPTLNVVLSVMSLRATSVTLQQVMAHSSITGTHFLRPAMLGTLQVYCVATSLFTAAVLYLYATGWTVGKHSKLTLSIWKILARVANLLATPYHIGIRMFNGRILRMIRLFNKVIYRLFVFAVEFPILAIPTVLICTGFFFYALQSGALASKLGWMPAWGLGAVHFVASSVQTLQEVPLNQLLNDSFLLVWMVAAVQSITCYFCTTILIPLIATRDIAMLPTDELQILAGTMSTPRRCGRCAFGPVDHTGCSNLSTHHGEIRANTHGVVSNACPRCGWFAYSLTDWPEWDPALSGERGDAIYVQRAWSELVIAVRAATKALVIPFAVLRVSEVIGLPPVVGVFLVLSYLVPWLYEVKQLFTTLYAMRTDHGRVRPAPQPVHGAARNIPPVGGYAPIDDSPSCGAARPVRYQDESETFEYVLAQDPPAKVYMAQGEGCTICLEDWTSEALNSVAQPLTPEAVMGLRSLDPGCLALRCGHVLHMECAQSVVSAGGGRHQRCPLCREPITLAGAVSAGVFA